MALVRRQCRGGVTQYWPSHRHSDTGPHCRGEIIHCQGSKLILILGLFWNVGTFRSIKNIYWSFTPDFTLKSDFFPPVYKKVRFWIIFLEILYTSECQLCFIPFYLSINARGNILESVLCVPPKLCKTPPIFRRPMPGYCWLQLTLPQHTKIFAAIRATTYTCTGGINIKSVSIFGKRRQIGPNINSILLCCRKYLLLSFGGPPLRSVC